jgi:hypothetical protein
MSRMRQVKFSLWIGGAYALLVLGLAALILFPPAVRAATSVHVEFQRAGHVYAAQTITAIGSTPATTSAAPSCGGVTCQARISVTQGAAVVTWGPGSSATQSNGARLEPMHGPLVVNLNTGDVVSIVEAADAAMGSDAQDASYGQSTAVVVATPIAAPGRALGINCTVAGNLTVTLAGDSSSMTFAIPVGFQVIPFHVGNVTVWTGTGSIWNLP